MAVLAGLALAGVAVLFAVGAILLPDGQPVQSAGGPPVAVAEKSGEGAARTGNDRGSAGPAPAPPTPEPQANQQPTASSARTSPSSGAGEARSTVMDGPRPQDGGPGSADQPSGSRSASSPLAPPPDDAPGGTTVTEAEAEALISGSDDFSVHEQAFLSTSVDLLRSGRCTIADFIEMGGWYRSSTRTNIYFTFCGGVSLPNRIDLDVSTGTLVQ